MTTLAQKYDLPAEEHRLREPDEGDVAALHMRANALMKDLSTIESDLRDVMVAIRRDADRTMDRATYESRLARNTRRSNCFYTFITVAVTAGVSAMIVLSTQCKI